MQNSEPVQHHKRSLISRLARILLKTVLALLILLIILGLLIQVPYVQDIIRGQAEKYLARKLQTKVRISKLYIRLPQTILLSGIYLEDQQHDTLLAAGIVRVDMHMWALLHSKVDVNEVQLDDITLKINRRLPDSVYNFQFIADAFGSKSPESPNKAGSSSMTIAVKSLTLDRIRLVYKDDVSGNDAVVWLGYSRTEMVNYDPSSPSPLHIGKFSLLSSQLVYRSSPDSLYTGLQLGSLTTAVKQVDLTKQIIHVSSLNLDSTMVVVHMGKKPPTPASRKTVAAPDTSAGWRFLADGLSLYKDNVQFDDDNQPRQKRGMDYMHLAMTGLSLQATNLYYDNDSISGRITQGQLKERSGFQLDKLKTDFVYTEKGASLSNLELQTPGSLLGRSARISYRSVSGIMKDPAHCLVDLQIVDSKVQVKDILTFVPQLYGQPAFSRPREVWQISTRMKGTLAALQVESLKFSGLNQFRIDLSGTLRNVTDPGKSDGQLVVHGFSGTRDGLLSLLPPHTLPENIAIPTSFNVTGKIGGGMDHASSDLTIHSSAGTVLLKGTASGFNRPKLASYDLSLHTVNLNLGYILKDTARWGMVTATISAKGKGFDRRTADATFSGQVDAAMIRGYEYNNFQMQGTLAAGQASIQSSIADTAIRFAMTASADLNNKYPGIKLDWRIDTLDLQALHLVNDSMALSLRGHILADFPGTNPDSLLGKLTIDSIIVHDGQKVLATDSIVLLAENSGDKQRIRLFSEMADMDWNGRYKLTEVAGALKSTLNHYYKINGFMDTAFGAQDWNMDMVLRTSPLVLSYMPAFKGTDTIGLHFSYNSDGHQLQGQIHAPKIQYAKNIIQGVQLGVKTDEKQLNYDLEITKMTSGSFQLNQTSVYGRLANNQLETSLLLKDARARNWYHLAGVLKENGPAWHFSLNPDSLLLNYDAWVVNPDNYIQYDSAGIVVHHFGISHSNESLTINSDPLTPTAPIHMDFNNFRISTLTHFAGQDSLLADGLMNGDVQVRNVLSSPVFTSDLTIKDLSYKRDSIGDLSIKVNNEKADAFSADILLQGKGNNVHASGDYYSGAGRMDLTLELGQLNLAIARSLSEGQLLDARGYLKGKLAITGTMDAPVATGYLHFDSTLIKPAISGEPLKLSEDKIEFDKDGFNFSHFAFADSAGNKATIDGNVYTRDYRNYAFDLSLYAENFQLLNAKPSPDKIFYGTMNLNSVINLKGDMNSPKVDGYISVNKKTNFVFVLPGSNPEVADREGVVRFVDADHRHDTLTAQEEAMIAAFSRRSDVQGMDISLRIATDSNAIFTMIIDERSGDALTARGRSNLVFGMDKSGKMDLTGDYEVESGSYNLSLDVLKRKFDIQRGSRITWTGDPMSATVDITATYIANTPSLDLIANEVSGRTQTEINKFKQKLPFLVTLNMEGDLLKPKITFDITLPPSVLSLWPDVDQKLQQVRGEESELNKQVFALLLLNRFVGEDPLQSAAGGGTNVGNMAFQSASQILTGQLDQLAASLIKGVDIHFDLNSQQDFSTGTEQDYTELNVSVSKRFFNDRITVNVGSNFDVQGSNNPNQNASNIAGDVAVDYKLTEDGRYMLRAYRKNQYEMAIEGQVVETGVSFILTFDYNKFKEIFMKVQKSKNVLPQKKPVNTTPSTENTNH